MFVTRDWTLWRGIVVSDVAMGEVARITSLMEGVLVEARAHRDLVANEPVLIEVDREVLLTGGVLATSTPGS